MIFNDNKLMAITDSQVVKSLTAKVPTKENHK